jgi:hypothetical protein
MTGDLACQNLVGGANLEVVLGGGRAHSPRNVNKTVQYYSKKFYKKIRLV